MSNSIIMAAKDIPILFSCDVFVLGLGMSGFSAAVSAARAGAAVIAVDEDHYPGGIATSTLMCSASNYFVTRDGKQVTFGLPIELFDNVVRERGAEPNYLRATQPQIPFDPEVMKRVMIQMLMDADVKTL
ncbi:MAG: FAD-dependent oxidoreductase, partial [Raoultibacter sp.]